MTPAIKVTVSEGPLPPALPSRTPGAGGIVLFEGIVRPLENDRPIAALAYEAYEPMAQMMIETIAAGLIQKHGVLAISVEHSKGRVEVGACSFRLTVAGKHRKEALAAADEFIDRLKADVPIWKRPAD